MLPMTLITASGSVLAHTGDRDAGVVPRRDDGEGRRGRVTGPGATGAVEVVGRSGARDGSRKHSHRQHHHRAERNTKSRYSPLRLCSDETRGAAAVEARPMNESRMVSYSWRASQQRTGDRTVVVRRTRPGSSSRPAVALLPLVSRRAEQSNDSDDEVAEDRCPRCEERQHEHSDVETDVRRRRERERLDLVVAHLRLQHVTVEGGRAPERVQQERDHEQRRPVEDDRGSGGVLVVECLRHQLGREGQERGGHQEQQVQHHQALIGGGQAPEDPVVGHPDPADRQEAGRVREIRRPLIGDPAPEIVEVRRRHVHLEDQQRDRDREHAVAERLHPVGRPVVARHPDSLRTPVEASTAASRRVPPSRRRRSSARPIAGGPPCPCSDSRAPTLCRPAGDRTVEAPPSLVRRDAGFAAAVSGGKERDRGDEGDRQNRQQHPDPGRRVFVRARSSRTSSSPAG